MLDLTSYFIFSVNKIYCFLKTEKADILRALFTSQTTIFVIYPSSSTFRFFVLNVKMTTNDLQAGESVEGKFFLRKNFHFGVKNFY